MFVGTQFAIESASLFYCLIKKKIAYKMFNVIQEFGIGICVINLEPISEAESGISATNEKNRNIKI